MRRLGVLFTILTLFTACGDGPLFEINDFQDKFDAVTYNNKVDILWVIDSTPSMAEDRQKLTGQIELMIQKMDQKKIQNKEKEVF